MFLIDTRWYKILNDIWGNKARTLLVVLSIAIGCFAVGVVAHMRLTISEDLVASYEAVNPAQIIITTEEGFDREFIAFINRLDNVQAVEGRRSTVLKFKRNPEDEWLAIRLIALAEYEDITVNKVFPETFFSPDPPAWPDPYVWPPPDRALILERTSLLLADLGFGRDAKQGDSIIIETPTGRERIVPIPGLAYDFSQTPATFAGMPYGFITFDTLTWLGLPNNFNQLHIVVDSQEEDWDVLKQAGRDLQERVEKAGYTVLRLEVPEPGKLPLDNFYQAITLILGVMGAFSLFLSIFLIINTISALLAQQVGQIGVMKTFGADTQQLGVMYLGMVAFLGTLALLIAMPAAIFVAREAVSFMSYFINFNLDSFTVDIRVILLQMVLAIFVPLLAALYPVLTGVRISIREAISNQGLSDIDAETPIIDWVLSYITFLSPPLVISLRNTFRQKVRLTLTLITLVAAGMVVIAVTSVRQSLDATLDEAMSYWQYDVQIQLLRPERIRQLQRVIGDVPNVEAIESWVTANSYRVRADESQSENILITALPSNSTMLSPNLIAGNWLSTDSTNQIVVNNYLLSIEPDLDVGSSIVLNIAGEEESWEIIGVVKTIGNVASAYTNYDYFSALIGQPNSVSSVQVTLHDNTPAQQESSAQLIEQRLEADGIRVLSKLTNAQQRQQTGTLFSIIVTLLMIMAFLMVLVGGLSLSGTMSLNVIERINEIGIMRAVGAGTSDVLQIFILEGLLIGILSWLGGLLLAIPTGYFLSYLVGVQFLNTPLTYAFSLGGMFIWLSLVIVLSIIATYLPSIQASSMSIRDVLMYE